MPIWPTKKPSLGRFYSPAVSDVPEEDVGDRRQAAFGRQPLRHAHSTSSLMPARGILRYPHGSPLPITTANTRLFDAPPMQRTHARQGSTSSGSASSRADDERSTPPKLSLDSYEFLLAAQEDPFASGPSTMAFAPTHSPSTSGSSGQSGFVPIADTRPAPAYAPMQAVSAPGGYGVHVEVNRQGNCVVSVTDPSNRPVVDVTVCLRVPLGQIRLGNVTQRAGGQP